MILINLSAFILFPGQPTNLNKANRCQHSYFASFIFVKYIPPALGSILSAHSK